MSNMKSIIFDLDDTLYPEEQYVLSGFKAVAKWAEVELGIPYSLGYRQLEDLFKQGIRNTTFNLFLSENGIEDESNIPLMVTAYRSHQPYLTAFPEVEGILDELSGIYQLGLISDGYLEVQQKKWNGLNLQHEFKAVIFSDQYGRENWKPSHRPFLEALKILKTKMADTMYIGDNPNKDFLGANELGIHTVMVERGQGVYSDATPPTLAHTAEVTIKNLNQLLDLLPAILPNSKVG